RLHQGESAHPGGLRHGGSGSSHHGPRVPRRPHRRRGAAQLLRGRGTRSQPEEDDREPERNVVRLPRRVAEAQRRPTPLPAPLTPNDSAAGTGPRQRILHGRETSYVPWYVGFIINKPVRTASCENGMIHILFFRRQLPWPRLVPLNPLRVVGRR